MTRHSIQIPRRPFSMDSPTTTVINAWNFRSVTPGDGELRLGEYLLSKSCKPSPSYSSPDSSWSEDDTIAANNIFVLTSAESSPICASPAPSPPSPPATVPVARTIIFDDIPPIPSIAMPAAPAPSVGDRPSAAPAPSAGSPPTRRRPVGNRPPNHDKASVKILQEAYKVDTFPSDGEKLRLARETGMTKGQVSTWFINRRKRSPTKGKANQQASLPLQPIAWPIPAIPFHR